MQSHTIWPLFSHQDRKHTLLYWDGAQSNQMKTFSCSNGVGVGLTALCSFNLRVKLFRIFPNFDILFFEDFFFLAADLCPVCRIAGVG